MSIRLPGTGPSPQYPETSKPCVTPAGLLMPDRLRDEVHGLTKYFFVDFYMKDANFATFVGGSMLTTYVAAPDEVSAAAAVTKAYPDSYAHQAYACPEIPQDCPYLNQDGVLMSALADQPCDPPDACKTHRRCWTHSVEQ